MKKEILMRGPAFKRVMIGVGATCAIAGAFAVGRAVAAGIPSSQPLVYSGTLLDANGAPLADGDYQIGIQLSSAADGTSPVCTQAAVTTPLNKGRFSVALPDTCTDAIRANSGTYVQVTVDNQDLGWSKIGAVPYAVEADHAVSADSADSAESAATLSADLTTNRYSAIADLMDEGLLDNSAGSDLLTRTQLDGRYLLATDLTKVTSWTAYTPTIITHAGSTVTGVQSVVGRWRRLGDSAEVRITTRFNADNASTEYLTWQLPSGMTPVALADSGVVGSGDMYRPGAVTACAVALGTDAKIYMDCNGLDSLRRSSVGATPNNYFVSLAFTVQVTGWTLTTP